MSSVPPVSQRTLRIRCGAAPLLVAVTLACAACLRAQAPVAARTPVAELHVRVGSSPSGPAFEPGSFGLAPASGVADEVNFDKRERDQANHALYDAFESGSSPAWSTSTGLRPHRLDSLDPFMRERQSTVSLAARGLPATPELMLPNLNPALRYGNEIRFSSSAGTFRFNQSLGGRGYYPLARTLPGAPLASFTTPNLGSTLMNFSASTYMGGATYGAQHHTGPSISLRLNF
jgi:hypothetical protein